MWKYVCMYLHIHKYISYTNVINIDLSAFKLYSAYHSRRTFYAFLDKWNSKLSYCTRGYCFTAYVTIYSYKYIWRVVLHYIMPLLASSRLSTRTCLALLMFFMHVNDVLSTIPFIILYMPFLPLNRWELLVHHFEKMLTFNLYSISSSFSFIRFWRTALFIGGIKILTKTTYTVNNNNMCWTIKML